MSASKRNEWKRARLGSFFKIKHGYAFKSDYFSDSGPYVLLTPGNFCPEGGLKMKGEKEKYYVGEFPSEYILRRGDLLVAMTDLIQNAPILGSPAIVTQDGKLLHNQRLGKIIDLDEKNLARNFLFYLLNASYVRSQIKGSATGSTVRHTAPDRIYSVEVMIPPLPTQRKIAAILSAYDDLIENNTRRIKILEEMAQSLYREWFVHFRFPGHEQTSQVSSAMGIIPEGWTVLPLASFGQIITGKTPSTEVAENFGDYMPFIKTPDMHGNIFCTQTGQYLSELGVASQKKKTIPGNSLCVSCIGTAGIVSITSRPSQTNQQINSIILEDQVTREFLYFRLLELRETINQFGANGATMVNLNKGKFEALNIVAPCKELLELFHQTTCAHFEQIRTLQLKTSNLRRTRDLLLPRLISGELDVSNLDIQVE